MANIKFHKSGWVWHNFGGPSEFWEGVWTPQPPLGIPVTSSSWCWIQVSVC